MKRVLNSVGSVPGFKASGIACGIKPEGQTDLALVVSESPAVAAGVFTQNKIQSPSVKVTRSNLAKARTVKAVLVNSGNANACTGPQGLEDCRVITRCLGKELGVPSQEILVASTGIIGVPLPREKIIGALPQLVRRLSMNGLRRAALAIRTTDLTTKTARVEYGRGRQKIVVGGIAKGSGMIHPNMATMLAFIQSNAAIDSGALRIALKQAVDGSFNRITVDGDCSTNDSVICLAGGRTANPRVGENSKGFHAFADALNEVCRILARKIVEDGEGATKFITVRVEGAKSTRAARKVAFSVATSNLVKTAVFGEDPNWGRIICAVGNAGVPLRPDRVDISLGSIPLVRNGAPVPETSPERIKKIMRKKTILIRIGLNSGREHAEVYSCDLSYDYVRINAEYAS
ncbi:MAG: bifunctional glutamate N-acetyltransferase/amino-acid acetyltransferase ArgJ [Nitrospinales bacterium]